MFFNIKYLTNAGKNLLDQASAGNTIIWSKCATSSRSYVNDEDPRNLRDIAVNGKYTSLGTVTTVDHGKVDPNNVNSNLIIKASLENSGTNVESGEARTFGVWAKSGENGTETLVIVAFWNLHEGNPETVPDQSQSKYSATVDLYVRTSDNVISTIDGTSTWATPLSEFIEFKETVDNKLATLEADIDSLGGNSELETSIHNIAADLDEFKDDVDVNLNKVNTAIATAISNIEKLNTFKTNATTRLQTLNDFKTNATEDLNNLNNIKDRVVTTHSANSTSTGDTQTIYGVKNFKNDIKVSGYTTCEGLDVNGNLNLDGNITASNSDVTINSLTCNKLNINEPFEEDFRKEIARSLAGNSTNDRDPAVGCMRLVAIPGAADCSAGTELQRGYSVCMAAFSSGNFKVFTDDNTYHEIQYAGTWQLITELLSAQENSYSFALAVRIL